MLSLPPAGERRLRFRRLLLGLIFFGLGIAFMVRSDIGLGPWDVLHQGITNRTGVSIGMVGIAVGILLLLTFPVLRERIGIGTVANTIVIGVVIDLALLVLPEVRAVPVQAALMVGGILSIALGSGAYIGAGLGPGPRDGLMTGLSRRTGASIRVVRTAIELTALGSGILLGGTFGVGTILMAVTIGPLVQFFLPRFSLPPLPGATPIAIPPHPPV